MEPHYLAAQLRKPEGEAGHRVAENMNTSNSLIILHTIEKLHLQPNDAVLEIGMGNGFFCKDVLAAADNVTYTGCDFSPLMIQEANTFNQERISAGKASFYEASAHAMPFADNTFSKIFTVNTIYFWEQPVQELTEIHRVLQPGGRAIISLRTRTSMLQLPFTAYDFHLYEKEELLPLFAAAGFADVRIEEELEPPFEVHGHDTHVQLHALYVIAGKK
ncbi:Methyltransferase domain-containing protein [Filimonas lacunae]|uniref:Methyltransferase domain-containing protein n=1 Tax=Filimonas lacunae TaxID=477680 RepID=A0A173M9K7_9BACT|nr:class I SAM-dependent methyltransferase [Filimonas lacunae]BAV04226.1 SAM-dependent methyltransferase [Filimonas lacunae]SIT13938.1 Methyltransferase domain-containing protein [Filimonas lacunae]